MLLKGIFHTILKLWLVLFFCIPALHAQIPNPKSKGQDYYVSNPDGILDWYSVQELDSICKSIEQETGAEFAIVLVNDYDGEDDFEFALSLFNKWGIGKKESNNGLLLFIAKDRREYRFISGYGMERLFPDAYLKRVGELYLVPNFQQGYYSAGVFQAVRFIEHVLKSPDSVKELKEMMPEAQPFFSWDNAIFKNSLLVILFFIALYIYTHLVIKSLLKKANKVSFVKPIFYGLGCGVLLMFVSVFPLIILYEDLSPLYNKNNTPYILFALGGVILAMRITTGRESIVKGGKDEEEKQIALKKFRNYLLVPMLLSPLALFDLIWLSNRMFKNRGRFLPPNNDPEWTRLNRNKDAKKIKTILDDGQRAEEQKGSRKYEIWQHSKTGKYELVPWEVSKKFDVCPACGYHTLLKNQTKTVVAANYSSAGSGEKFDKCQFCNYKKHIEFYTIAKKTRSSSSSSSGGSSGGGSSSSSGSFGGGSSGGGGAGGRW
ncbi:TPM domain-containing protein [Sphingobacterium sp. CZ-2]|uniref:TPM domain-containing protein n=1 Tax=Sphingobacterium sp. CZ-2 TaxID=2557994 RepID=UPI00106F16AD|nr:TPM domain-containing protein [Sphingobacterium sp. CZ-2]QBR11345.1 TPM domain-containing protein [Sphingobacterium sp. CZ-2]